MLGLLPLLLAAAPLPAFERTYSFWLGSERVGAVAVRFDGQRYRYESTRVVRRGRALEAASFWCETNAGGVGVTSSGKHLSGPTPSTLALLQVVDGAPRGCVEVEDEQDGHRGQVCAQRKAQHLSGEMLGEPFAGTLGSDGAPDSLEFPTQGVHFISELGPLPLPRPRDLFGAAVSAPALERLAVSGARVHAQGPGCEAEMTPERAQPPRDVPLPSAATSPLLDAARDATHGDRTSWAAARHLAAFVDHAIESTPPELDEHDPAITWRRRRGGCVGHAAVFNALARALGLHSRTAYGLLFEDGEWRSHAWSEVEVEGRFYGVDPSRGLAPVGPEHLALVRDDDPDPLRPGRCLLALPSMTWSVGAQPPPSR